MWFTQKLPQSIWFSGATNWNNHIIQAGGFGFPNNKYSPIAATLRLAPLNSTATLHPLPSARFGEAVVTGQDGKVYAFGGMNVNNALLGSVVALSPGATSNPWLAKKPLPIPRVALSAAVASNGLIYTLGGDRLVSGRIVPSNVVEIYHPTTNTWTNGPSLPIALDDTAAATSGTKIYVFGGYSNGPSAAAYSLDMSNPSSWVRIPNMPTGADLPSAATDPTDADGSIYVAGGAIGTTGLRRVDVYDPVQNLWSCIKPMPQARVGAPTVAVAHGPLTENLAVSGGLNGNIVENTLYYTETGLNTADAVAPAVTAPPVPAIVSGVQATTTRVDTSLRWTRSDSATDILADNLQQSFDGDQTWTDVATPWATLDPGYIYRGNTNRVAYRVSPTDCNNNTAGPVAGPQFGTHLYTESSLHYSGSWTLNTLSTTQGGRFRASVQTGAVASFTFTGRDIGWVALKGPTRGQAYVSVDGTRLATINLYAKAEQPREVVWHHAWGSFGTHNLAIRVLGTKGHPSVDVDSLFVITKPAGTLNSGARPHAVAPGRLSAAPANRVARP
jgi:hypothetical protein